MLNYQGNRANKNSKQMQKQMRDLMTSLIRSNILNRSQLIEKLKKMFPQQLDLVRQNTNYEQTQVTSIICDTLSQQNHGIVLPNGFIPLLISILETKPGLLIYSNILQSMKYSFQDSQEIKTQIMCNVNFYASQITKYLEDHHSICKYLLQFLQTLLDHSKLNENVLILAEPLLKTYKIEQLTTYSIYCLSYIFKANPQIMKEKILNHKIVQQFCLQILDYKYNRICLDRRYSYHILQFMQACLKEYIPQTFQTIILPFLLLLNSYKYQIGKSDTFYQPYKLEQKSLNIILLLMQDEVKLLIFVNYHQLTEGLFQRLNNNDNQSTFKLLKQIFQQLQKKYGNVEQVDRAIQAKKKQFYEENDKITNSMDQEYTY